MFYQIFWLEKKNFHIKFRHNSTFPIKKLGKDGWIQKYPLSNITQDTFSKLADSANTENIVDIREQSLIPDAITMSNKAQIDAIDYRKKVTFSI